MNKMKKTKIKVWRYDVKNQRPVWIEKEIVE